MYISSGGGSGKGSALPNQQSNSASTTPATAHNAALQQPIYPQHIQSVVMPPAFHAQYIPRQPASQIYSSTPPIHFPQTQMPPNFTSYSYFFTNSLISTPHRPSIIQSGVPHNPNHLALPSVNMVAPNVPSQTPCQPPIHPPSGNNFPGKKRSHALPIINPITKKNIMEEFELSKNVGLDSKQQTKSSETEVVSKPIDNSSGSPQNQKLKKSPTSDEPKEIIVTEPHANKEDLLSKINSNIDFKDEQQISNVKYEGANQDFNKNTKNNTEIGREQPAQKEDVDTQCSNLQNENRTKNQPSTNHPNGEQVSKDRANICHNKPICDKSVESVIGSQVNVASTKGVKLLSTNTVERSIERKKHGVERQRKKSHSSENMEKRISENSKKKNYREEELKRKDRVENKNVSTDISILRKTSQSDDSVDSSVLCPSSKEVKSTQLAKEELNIETVADDKLESQKSKNELVHSKEIKEISSEIRKECAKPNVVPSKAHSGGPSQNSSLFQMFYKDGQWSPSNLQGKRVYDLQQLHHLNNSPLSKVKPKLKKIIGIVSETPKASSSGRSYKNSHAFVNNNESSSMQSSNKSGSKIGSNQTKQVNKLNKPGMIHVRLSLRENIKLSETENAWRPSHFKALDDSNPAIREKEELFRKVRGILNKLTPEKFDALVEEIMKLQIDTAEKINGVMMLVFEKAIDEPNFSASYARLCQRVADKNALCNNDERSESKKTTGLVPFKTALLDKTEREFNVNVIDLHAKNAKLKPTVDELKKCNDTKKKQELQIILEEQEYLLRKRSCGTVRFIGELFKMSMLTGKIIKACVYKLLDSKSEDKLECLCKLLTTVGKKFEKTATGNILGEQCLDDVIRKMQSIVDRKVDGTKVSNRVRFMLQDVIDLRRNNWVSNHRSDPQKLPESLQNEQQTNTSSAYNSSNKRGDRAYDSRISSHSTSEHSSRAKGTHTCEESWFKHSKGSHMVDTNKLKPIFQTENMFKLGDSSYYQWRRDRAGSTQTETKERFLTQVPDLALQRMKSPSKSEETRHSVKKGLASSLPSIPKSNSQTNIQTLKTATLPKKIKSATTVASSLSICPNDILSTPTDISEKDNKLITDVLNRLVDAVEEESVESCLVIWSELPKKLHWALIYNIFTDYLHLRKVKLATRQILSKIVLHLIHKKQLLLEDFNKGYFEFSKIANEIVIDVPEAWKYIFEFIGDFILKETISIRLFWNQNLLDIGMGKYFLKNCISYFVREKGYNYTRNLWQSENFEWKEFLDERDASKFIEENKFQFLNSNEDAESSTIISDAASAIKQIKNYLQDDNNTSEDVMEYLHRSNATVNNEFVGNLSLALCESAVVRNLNNSNFNQSFFRKKCIPLLLRYIDSKEDRELRCLSTIADFAQGFDDTDNLINNIFYELYEADVISQDSFLKWWNTKKQILDKRTPLLGLSRFFNLFQFNTEASDEN